MGAPALQRFIVSNLTDHAWVLDQGAFEPPNPGPSKDPRPERRGRVLVQDGFSTQAPDGIIGPTISEVLAGVPQ
jgi:hypothetical protein